MKLYEIPLRYREALDSIDVDEETGEIMNSDALTQFEMDAKEKIENAALYCLELKQEAACLKDEAARMSDRAKALDNRLERIKGLILTALEPFGGKVKTPRVTAYRRSTATVAIDEGANLPEAFVTKKVIMTPNKIAIRDYLKAGEMIDGAHLEMTDSLIMR